MEDKNKIEQIAAKLLNQLDVNKEKESQKKRRMSLKQNPILSITINGGKDVEFINGNKTVHQTINHYNNITPIRPNVIVQTGVGVISASQKHQLLNLRDQVVEASVVRTKPKTHAEVMAGLKNYMRVNKYDEILKEDFDKAVKWLIKQKAIMQSMKSAPKKIGDWRKSRYTAIHTRCNERNWVEWRIEYMLKKFGTSTMTQLSDADLDALYRTVINKK